MKRLVITLKASRRQKRKDWSTAVRSTGGEESLMLKCTACEKTYGRKDCLRKHFKRTHIDIIKKYETFACHQCDKTFSSRDKLTRHKIQHTASDWKPFKCEERPERFMRKDAMVRHLKRQHTNSWHLRKYFQRMFFFHPLNPFRCLILKSLFPKKELKNSFQPGRNILYKVGRRISARPGAFGPDNYHIATNKMPAYEEALISYLKGILSLFLLLSWQFSDL